MAGEPARPLAGLPRFSVAWLVYGRKPAELPRRWRGLVGARRLDVAVRVLLAAMYPGGRLLDDALLVLFLDEGGGVGDAVVFEPGCMPREAVYEHDIGGFFLESLRGATGCRLARGVSAVYAARALRRAGGGRVVALTEAGGRLGRVGEGDVFILGSYYDPPPGLVGEADARASIGPLSYLASHVAAYINAVRLGLLPQPG